MGRKFQRHGGVILHRLEGPGCHHRRTEGIAGGRGWKRPSHRCWDRQGGEGAQTGGQSLHLQAVFLSKPSHQRQSPGAAQEPLPTTAWVGKVRADAHTPAPSGLHCGRAGLEMLPPGLGPRLSDAEITRRSPLGQGCWEMPWGWGVMEPSKPGGLSEFHRKRLQNWGSGSPGTTYSIKLS